MSDIFPKLASQNKSSSCVSLAKVWMMNFGLLYVVDIILNYGYPLSACAKFPQQFAVVG